MSQSVRLTDVNELSGTEKEHLKNYIRCQEQSTLKSSRDISISVKMR